ncbi:MAG: TetR family transcriptional regulator [Acidimicrobiia bacterium]
MSQATRKRFVPPTPPRTPKAAATRRQLIGVAGDLFIERGYDAVSLKDIADEAGLTKGAIYGHFSSKGQLLVEVIRWKLAEREHAPEYLEAVAQPGAAALLIDAAGREARLLQIDAAAASRHDPDVAAGMRELNEERFRAIEDATGDARDPHVVAYIIEAIAFGTGAQEAFGNEVPDPERWIETFGPMLDSAFSEGLPDDD